MSTTAAIETYQLRKAFGEKTAVEDLTLTVGPGEVFGFLGPNGAGKTTSIKMLLGLTFPSGGEARVLGEPLGHTAVRAKIGFLPEHFRFHDWLTGAEFLRLHAGLYGMAATGREARIAELLELVGLAAFANRKLREYSKGMLQRVGLAQALLNQPALVFLDEPTSGLDPLGRRLVRDLIDQLKQQGTTVFLNSHLLSEVEITCDRVAFIKHGRVVRTAALKELVDGAVQLEIRARALPPGLPAALAQWDPDVHLDGDKISMALQSEDEIAEINRYLVGQGIDVLALAPQRLSLEDLFIQIVGRDGGL